MWTRDLLTGEESLRLENVTRSPVRGLYPWTASAYPDACREIWDCGEAFYTGCGLKISVEDPVSHTPHDLGLWPRGTHLLDISNDLAVLRGGTAYCDIKSFSTAFEVIDLRSLHPYDWAAIKASVKKTHRVLYVNEETEITNFGELGIFATVPHLRPVG